MNKMPNFKQKSLVVAIALMITGLPAFADDVEGSANSESSMAVLEEVLVTAGYRASLIKAMDIKRDANSIVDAIAAEDIGKFPDQNVAESLQRIPGITIDRNGGEGQFVTVRGMGPAFNAILLNGRVLATENTGREFSFDILASELISGADVYKTPTASLIEGGIGSTINVHTARPFDLGEFKAVISAKGQYDDASEQLTPQYSGLISNIFMEGRLGVLVSGAVYERDFQKSRSFTDGFNAGVDLDFDNDGVNELSDVFFPTYWTQDIDHATREREGGTFAVQFQATDNLLLTLDGLYSKLDVNSNSSGVAWFSNPGAVIDAEVDANNTITSYTLAEDSAWTEISSFSRPRFAETKQIGINVDWVVTEQLSMVFDVSVSEAEDTQGGVQNYFLGMIRVVDELRADYGAGTIPVFSGVGSLTDPNGLRSSWGVVEGRDVYDSSDQASLDVRYDFDNDGALAYVKSGLAISQREKELVVVKTPGGVIGSYWDRVDLPADVVDGIFDASDWMSGESGGGFNAFLDVNADAIRAFQEADGGVSYAAVPIPSQSGLVSEDTVSFYVELGFEGERWGANIGVRYADTSVESQGTAAPLMGIQEFEEEENLAILGEEQIITEDGDYSVVLPSGNFRYDLSEDVQLRVAAARSITRPTLSDLQFTKSYNVREFERSVFSTNPSLEPFMADNYDISLTWFVNDSSYVSAALYRKKLTNEIVNGGRQVVFSDLDITVDGVSVNEDRTFTEFLPVNSSGSATRSGIELTGQYSFDSGFGVLANMTVSDPNVEEDSDNAFSYNLVGFYDKNGIEARLAYAFRDTYMAGFFAQRGQPNFVREYGQWDFSASYDVNDNLSIFLEGINLTNERKLEYSIYENRFINLEDTGRRFAVGGRYSF